MVLQQHKAAALTISVVLVLLIFVAIQILIIIYSGQNVPRPETPREPISMGAGEPLKYVVMGDSTSVSQGGDYEQGYAWTSARELAKTHAVTWMNIGVSGARAHDIATTQLEQAVAQKPDLVLIAVGANDVTHVTNVGSVRNDLHETVRQLVAANCNVRIMLTGSPDMGSVPRFPQPTRWIAGKRTEAVNKTVRDLVAPDSHLTFVPIAERTGPIFRKHPELFAADKFHPAKEGYDLWNPVVIQALHEALAKPDQECAS